MTTDVLDSRRCLCSATRIDPGIDVGLEGRAESISVDVQGATEESGYQGLTNEAG